MYENKIDPVFYMQFKSETAVTHVVPVIQQFHFYTIII